MKVLSFKNMILNIPESFYSKGAFAVLMMYILSLPLVLFHVAFFWDNLISLFLIICGTFSQLFAGLYIISRFVRGKVPSFKSLLNLRIWDLLLLVLLLWSTISAFLANDLKLALMGTGYRSEGLTMYFTYASIYVCGKLVKSAKSRKILLISFCLSISLLTTTIYLQTLPGVLDLFGTIGTNLSGNGLNTAHRSSIFLNRNHFAYMLTLCILGIAGFSIYSKRILYAVSLLLFTFNLWALIKNNTFGCYLAVLAGLLFLSIIFYFINKKMIKKILVLLLIFVTVTILCESRGTGTISNDFNTLVDDVAHPTQTPNPGNGRLELWKKAVDCVFERPIFGYGPEGLHNIYLNTGYTNDRPHNEYLQMAAFHGIPALCIYLGALFTLFLSCAKSLKKLSKELLIIGAMIFAYCISAFFGNTMYYTTPYFYLFLGILSGVTSKKLDH